MKVKFNRWYHAILSALLGMLGFESCDIGNGMVEYGVPNADFIVSGVVTDEANHPIEGIKAKFEGDFNRGIDSVMTDASGRYEIDARTYPDLYGCRLIVEDVDGEANGGQFLSDTLDLSAMKPVQVEKGDDHWYSGKYELKADIQMKK